MIRITKYFIFPVLILLFSCESINWDKLNNPCIDCYNEKPVEGLLEIKLSFDKSPAGIPIEIHRGDFELYQVEWVDTAYETDYEIWVPVNKYYSVRAEYEKDNKKIFVFDGDDVKIVKETSDCDEVCWRARDGKVDLRLKY